MVAIIIPYYKLTFFEETLQSLSNQTDKRFKVYIGDDASPENPKNLLEKYEGKFDFFYHRFDDNLGGKSLTQQWERCVALSNNEEWIMILGDDDVLGNNVVESFYRKCNAIHQYKSNVVRFSTKIINEKTHVISTTFTHPMVETGQEFLARKFSKKTRSSLSEYVFKKENVLKKGFEELPLAWHSDDLAIFEFSMPNLIYSINSAFLLIRVSNLSITGDDSNYDEKNGATFDFAAILLKKYSNLFTRVQKKIILKKLEVAFFNICNFANYKTIIKYHFKYISYKSAIQFQLRLIEYIVIIILKKLKIFNLINTIYQKIK